MLQRWQRNAHCFAIDLRIGEEQQALDYIAQLPNIAGPGIFLESLNSRRSKWNRPPSVLRADLPREMCHERGQIFAALAQRRQFHRKYNHPMIQVAAECLLSHE